MPIGGGDPDESRSTSGYVFTLSGGAISWCSKKQDYIALSTMEVEYVACSLATQEAIWLRSFLRISTSLQRLMTPLSCCVTTQQPSSSIRIRNFIGRPSKGIITSCKKQ